MVTHVRLGLEEVACCLLTGTSDAEPDRDAATYWLTEPPGGGSDAVAGLVAIRRIASATQVPRSALIPLWRVVAVLRLAVVRLKDGVLEFQGCVLTTGDFLATWAVELAVHQLDLGRDLAVPEPPSSALSLGRRTVEALLGCPIEVDDDADALLLATGRRPLTTAERDQLGPYAERLPLL